MSISSMFGQEKTVASLFRIYSYFTPLYNLLSDQMLQFYTILLLYSLPALDDNTVIFQANTTGNVT